MKRHAILVVLLVLASAAGAAWAAEILEADPYRQPGTPRAMRAAGSIQSLSQVRLHEMPAVDVERLRREDAEYAATHFEKDRRIGHLRKIAVDPTRFGTWEDLPNGDRLWRAQVRSARALWLVLGFTTFRLDPGAELFIYSPGGEIVQGPFTSDHVRDHGQLWTTPIEGDALVVELYWPKHLAGRDPNIHLGKISHGYEPFGSIGQIQDPPQSEDPTVDAGACNIDVQCPLGDDWQDEKQGVVLTLRNGSRICTGSMIAQAGGEECLPMMLTADHCHGSVSDGPSMSLLFNFERPACESGTPPTDDVHGGGAVLRATSSNSDFSLFEMNTMPPAEFNPYWNGWNRNPAAATETYGIHHPANDEKKICYNDDAVIDGSNYGPNHWRITEWEQGTTEGGSSGSPLFDQDSRIIGQLHGGTASCSSITWDEYGKIDASWEGDGAADSRLRDWLDPSGTGEEQIDGTYGPVCGAPAPSLSVNATTVDDTSGNGDSIVDVDETFTLLVDLINRGSLDATNVSGTLSTSTPGVVLNDGGADWVDIPSSEIRGSNAPHFNISTTAGFVCGDSIELGLFLVSDERPEGWNREVSIPTGTPQVTINYEDDMESGVGTWTAQTLQGASAGWAQSTTQAQSGSTSWFVADPAEVSDHVLSMESFVVQAGTELIFAHRLNTEGGFDGGVLEYQQDAGAWTDAGALIVEGGYNDTISTQYSSPLAGRDAWSGDNGGFQPVRVALDSLTGSTVQFRWRFASDTSVSDEGWYVDDVSVERTDYLCSPVVPGEVPSGIGATPFTVDKDPGGYLLTWSAPTSGAAVSDYVLYSTTLNAYAPTCEANLGTGTSAVLADMTDNRGFLVVARGSSGEGSYGVDGAGSARAKSAGGDVCP
ncbi:hypothetical protein ABI59_21315 [Acidobacteria bacterium Mor1]|nr:hypothetical protein ABI59_21315 [Acidobacteria bacterium Mor1]